MACGCNTPKCDALAACDRQRFDTQTEYSDCLTIARATIDACFAGCQGPDVEQQFIDCEAGCTTQEEVALAQCISHQDDCHHSCIGTTDCAAVLAAGLQGCSDQQVICNNGCDAVNTACTMPCDTASTTCHKGCDDTRTGCLKNCDDARASCVTPCFLLETDTEVNDCLKACADIYDGCTPPCGAAWSTCNDGCDSAFTNCITPCATARADCLAGCADSAAGCAASAENAFAACVAGAQSAEAACEAICDATAISCTDAAVNAFHACEFGCETAREIDTYADEKASTDCAKHCCEAKEKFDDGTKTQSKCVNDATMAHDDCMLAVIGPSRGCYEGCQAILRRNGWSDTHESLACEEACAATLAVGTNDCAIAQTLADFECANGLYDEFKCCGSVLNECYYACEKPYLNANRDCEDAKTLADGQSLVDNEQCEASCDGIDDSDEQLDCERNCAATLQRNQDAAYTAYRTCFEPLVKARFECRLKCCQAHRGTTQVALDYQMCWEQSDCEKDDPLKGVDCTAAFDACLAGHMDDGYRLNPETGHYEARGCFLCGPEAAAAYTNAPVV